MLIATVQDVVKWHLLSLLCIVVKYLLNLFPNESRETFRDII